MIKTKIQAILENKPGWVNRQLLLLISTILIFTMAMVMGEPVPQATAMNMHRNAALKAPAAIHAMPDTQPKTANPNWVQTNGILLGSSILVLIIIATSLAALRQKTEEPLAIEGQIQPPIFTSPEK